MSVFSRGEGERTAVAAMVACLAGGVLAHAIAGVECNMEGGRDQGDQGGRPCHARGRPASPGRDIRRAPIDQRDFF
jgi:hypothetical protein